MLACHCHITKQVAEGSDGVSAEAKAVELRFLVGLSEILASEKTPTRSVYILAPVPLAQYILRHVLAISAGDTIEDGYFHKQNSALKSTHHQSVVRLPILVHLFSSGVFSELMNPFVKRRPSG